MLDDVNAQAVKLNERMRTGLLAPKTVKLAARLGHKAALVLFPKEPQVEFVVDKIQYFLKEVDHRLQLEVAFTCVDKVLSALPKDIEGKDVFLEHYEECKHCFSKEYTEEIRTKLSRIEFDLLTMSAWYLQRMWDTRGSRSIPLSYVQMTNKAARTTLLLSIAAGAASKLNRPGFLVYSSGTFTCMTGAEYDNILTPEIQKQMLANRILL